MLVDTEGNKSEGNTNLLTKTIKIHFLCLHLYLAS